MVEVGWTEEQRDPQISEMEAPNFFTLSPRPFRRRSHQANRLDGYRFERTIVHMKHFRPGKCILGFIFLETPVF
jgi:hypothetical protein